MSRQGSAARSGQGRGERAAGREQRCGGDDRAGARRRRPEAGRAPVDGVKNIIAVGAGKGGVGKTTVAVNLAVALAATGSRVALLDADMYGPNVPIMLGFEKGLRLEQDGKHILPAEACGVQTVSMGFLTADDAPVIWRGRCSGAIQQFFAM